MKYNSFLRIISLLLIFSFATTTIAWSAPSVIATPPTAGEAISSLAPPSRFSEDIREESFAQFLRGLLVPGVLLLLGIGIAAFGYNLVQNKMLSYALIMFPVTYLLFAPFASEGGSGGSRNFWKLSNAEQRAMVREAAHDAAMNHDQDKATILGTAKELGMDIDEFNKFLDNNPFHFKNQKFYDEGASPAEAAVTTSSPKKSARPRKPASPPSPTPTAVPGAPKKAEPWANLLAPPAKPAIKKAALEPAFFPNPKRSSPPESVAKSPSPPKLEIVIPAEKKEAIEKMMQEFGALIATQRKKRKFSIGKLLQNINIQNQSRVSYAANTIENIEKGEGLTLTKVYYCFEAIGDIDKLTEFLDAKMWLSKEPFTYESNQIGTKIRSLRNQARLSEKDLGDRTREHYDPRIIAFLELGKNISYARLVAIEEALEVNLLPFLLEIKLDSAANKPAKPTPAAATPPIPPAPAPTPRPAPRPVAPRPAPTPAAPALAAPLQPKLAPPKVSVKQIKNEEMLRTVRELIINILRDTEEAAKNKERKSFDYEIEVGANWRLELSVGKAKDGSAYTPRLSTASKESGTVRIRGYEDKLLEGYVIETERVIKGEKMTMTYLVKRDEKLGFNRIGYIERFKEILKRYLELTDEPNKNGESKKITFDAIATRGGKNTSIRVSATNTKGKSCRVVLATGKSAGPVSITIAYDDDLECDLVTITNKKTGEVVTSIKWHDERRGINIFQSIDKYRTLLKRQLLDIAECNKEGKYKCLGRFEVDLNGNGQYSIFAGKETGRKSEIRLTTGINKTGTSAIIIGYDSERKWYTFKTERAVGGEKITTTSVIGFDPIMGTNDFFQIEKDSKPAGLGPPIVSIEELESFPKESAQILIERFEKIITEAVSSNPDVTIESIQDALLESRITASTQRIKVVVKKLRPQSTPATVIQSEIEVPTIDRQGFDAEFIAGIKLSELVPLGTEKLSPSQQKVLEQLQAKITALLAPPASTVSLESPHVPADATLVEDAPPATAAVEPAAIYFDEFSRQLGARIRERREEEPKWSREKLSEVIKEQTGGGVIYSYAVIAAIERGEKLTFAKLYDCFNALEILDELIERLDLAAQSEAIGKRMRALREGKDWSQANLAAEAGYSPSPISQLEGGKNINCRLLATVEWVLKTNLLSFLFSLKQNPPQPTAASFADIEVRGSP